MMKKLNLGCGNKYSLNWTNVDFHSDSSSVISCNLLQPLPFPNNSFDAVYSSHLLEHFSKEDALKIMYECFRLLKPGGIVRMVVPDLEYTCREYLRVIDRIEHEEVSHQYEWIILELIDQMVRTKAGGLMADYLSQIQEDFDKEAMHYVEQRVGTHIWQQIPKQANLSIAQKILSVKPFQIKNKLVYAYLKLVKQVIPSSLRQAMLDSTPLGEKHKWMYDRYSLNQLFRKAGFIDILPLDAQTSSIKDFHLDSLDINTDGTPYKPGSLYFEGIKPNSI